MEKFNKYKVIKKAVNYELANFIFNYFLLKRDAVKYMYDNNITYDTGMLGTWSDQQVPNTYLCIEYRNDQGESYPILSPHLPQTFKEYGKTT